MRDEVLKNLPRSIKQLSQGNAVFTECRFTGSETNFLVGTQQWGARTLLQRRVVTTVRVTSIEGL